jgi:hypothetical protein
MLADTPPLSILKVTALLFLQEEPTLGSKPLYISKTMERKICLIASVGNKLLVISDARKKGFSAT